MTTMTTPVSIAVKDIGPVEEFRLDLDRPGLWILRGHQGAGKTTILRTVQLATDGRTDIKPTKRDGAKKGTASVAGKTLSITRKIIEDGELTVDGLGDLDVAALHSPKFIDAATRDKHRIRTLIRLAGVKADASLFHEIVGGKEKFDAIVDIETLETDDLVEMAARVKRRIEAAAQAAEAKLATAKADIRAQGGIMEGIDTTAPHDEAGLQATLRTSIERHAAEIANRGNGLAIQARSAMAQKELDGVEAGPSIEDAKLDLAEAAEVKDRATARVVDLENILSKARADLERVKAEHVAAMDTLAAAKRHADLTAKWRADITAAESVAVPSEAQVAAADAAVKQAQAAIQLGVRVRQAIAAQAKIEQSAKEAERHESSAKRLRVSASATLGVLSDTIAGIADCPLRVAFDDDGESRLVIATDRSGDEPFDELSDGERWPVILRLAAGRNRLIVLPQAAYGELSESTRTMLHELAAAQGCFLLTAQADDGNLRGDAYA